MVLAKPAAARTTAPAGRACRWAGSTTGTSELVGIARLRRGGYHGVELGAGTGEHGGRDRALDERRVDEHRRVLVGPVLQHRTGGEHGAAEIGQDDHAAPAIGPVDRG